MATPSMVIQLTTILAKSKNSAGVLDGPGDGSALEQVFLGQFAVAMASPRDTGDIEDGQQHVMADTNCQLRIQQVSGRSLEERHGLLGLQFWSVEYVNDCVGPVNAPSSALASVMSTPAEREVRRHRVPHGAELPPRHDRRAQMRRLPRPSPS